MIFPYYDKLSRSPKAFKSFSGLDFAYEKVESRYDEFERIRLSKRALEGCSYYRVHNLHLTSYLFRPEHCA